VFGETYVSFTTVVFRPRNNANRMKIASTATARIPQIPPGKLHVVVSVVVTTSVAVPVTSGSVAVPDGAGALGCAGACALGSGAPVVVVGL
jgi:hypothetical protein